ncbi:MAG: riboflavin biosynthesis protein RibF [Planctomycetaceae bacterium]
MQPIAEPIVFPPAADRRAPCAVAVGNFDGVHLGHAAIVSRLRSAAARHGVPAVAVTFDPHPARVLRPDAAPVPLTTPRRRAELLLGLGVDLVCVQPADAALMAVEAEDFFARVLRGRHAARAVVEGRDFRFGARRRGDVALLDGLCAAAGVDLEVVEPVVVGDAPVSSSRIRGLVAGGRMAEARSLLTAPYRLSGTVVVGARRGATIGFPTANLAGIATLLPALGVYAARATVDGVTHPAAVHVGPNATFGETAVSVEAHLVGFGGDLYGRMLDVDFLDHVRDTRRFASVEELKARLADDVATAVRSAAAAASPTGTT